MLVAVLKDWVTETKDTPRCIEPLYDLCEVGQRPGQAIDLVDDDLIHATRVDVGHQQLQGGPVHGFA